MDDSIIFMYFPSIPVVYTVELAYTCNHYCSACSNVLRSNWNNVLHEWKRVFHKIILQEKRRYSPELIRLSGGEPTLHPEFLQIIPYLDAFSIPHATFTNGRWNEPAAIIDTLKRCQHFVGLLVSLHGSNADSHSAFTGEYHQAFGEICRNIQMAAEAGLEVFTNTVLTKYNCDEVEDIIAFSRQLGAGYSVFNRYLGPPHIIEPTEKQLRQAIQRIEQLRHDGISCRLGDCVPPCFISNHSEGSNSGIEHCTISPDGSVKPDNLTHYSFGNLFEQSIEEIWQSDKAQWYRHQIPEQCLECIELSRCRGGCRSLIIEYGLPGDPLMKSPIKNSIPETLDFSPEWRPIPFFTIREERFGYLLCRYNWSVPVTSDAKPLLDAIMNREATLAELHERFGDAGLELIGHLYKEGCLEFE